ncbi:MAG: sigma-70 family RNA polymerase sigma factor [Bacteroidota bacterium]
MDQTAAITLYQPLLTSIALKMVGSLQDAEDIVQDTFLKWLTIDQRKIENTKAYLVRAVTNNALNHIKSFRQSKSNKSIDEVHHQLPGLVEEKKITKFDFDNEVSEALNILNKKLEPLEKAVYVMREFFNVEYDEIQHLFDKKSAYCRKLVSRAKGKLAEEKRKITKDISPGKFVENFKNACDFGNMTHLIQDLKKEISEKLS